jgi:hypothetical protein
MNEQKKAPVPFSRILLMISLVAAVAMIVGSIVIQSGGPAVNVPAAFSH